MGDICAIRSAVARRILILGCVGELLYGAPATSAAAFQVLPISATDSAARSLSDQQRDIIKHRVLREANVSIVPTARGEPEQFASELASALKDAGAAVSFGKDVAIQNGQTGLLVYYDHTVPADASVFLALDRAGLKPEDHDIPGAPAATIMVGPSRSQF